jgi:lysophospholipase L1-like esterase
LSCGDPDSLCDRFFKPFRDGIHFGPEGQQLLGQALYQAAFSDCTPSALPKPLE